MALSANELESYILTPVGVKNAGIPAPPARILSAIDPCGQSSIATFPVRYWVSNNLLLPRYDRIIRLICLEARRGERPPRPAAPALFETTVKFFRPSPRRSMAPIIVSDIQRVII
jgi:hypothetical protein